MLTFVRPTNEHVDDVLSFYNEFEQRSETCIGYVNFKKHDA